MQKLPVKRLHNSASIDAISVKSLVLNRRPQKEHSSVLKSITVPDTSQVFNYKIKH